MKKLAMILTMGLLAAPAFPGEYDPLAAAERERARAQEWLDREFERSRRKLEELELQQQEIMGRARGEGLPPVVPPPTGGASECAWAADFPSMWRACSGTGW